MKLKSIIALKYVPIREWTRIRSILVVFLTLICHSNAFCAQDSINAQQLYKQYANLPTDKLYRKGHALLIDNKLDDAMVCFTIVAGRYNTGMSSEEKRICALYPSYWVNLNFSPYAATLLNHFVMVYMYILHH